MALALLLTLIVEEKQDQTSLENEGVVFFSQAKRCSSQLGGPNNEKKMAPSFFPSSLLVSSFSKEFYGDENSPN